MIVSAEIAAAERDSNRIIEAQLDNRAAVLEEAANADVLGPIDPQVRNDRQWYVPALGYLEQYERLVQKSADGTLTTAELT